MSEYSDPQTPAGFPAGYSTPVLTDTEVPHFDPAPSAPVGNDPSDSSVTGKAAESAQAGKQAAAEVAQTAAEKAKDVVGETKVQAQNVLAQAQGQVKEQTAAQHRNLVTNLRSLGDELSAMKDSGEQSGQASQLVGQAAERVHSAASWLDAREPGQLVDELRGLARRKPAAFVIGALVAGVAAGRLTRGVVAA